MALGICYRAMKMGFKVPDGIMMAYPALDLHRKTFTPSFMISLVDHIVPFTFLNIC